MNIPVDILAYVQRILKPVLSSNPTNETNRFSTLLQHYNLIINFVYYMNGFCKNIQGDS